MRTLLTLAICLAVHQIAFSQQADRKAAPLNYGQLVKGLVSPNQPIHIRNYPEIISVPPHFDWKAQERIEKNRAMLFDHCEEALPFLIDGCGDEHFSMVSKWSEDGDWRQ